MLVWYYATVRRRPHYQRPLDSYHGGNQAHSTPAPRSLGSTMAHYHEWDPSQACVTDHRSPAQRREARPAHNPGKAPNPDPFTVYGYADPEPHQCDETCPH
jgi:hypothetical protein